MTANPTKKKLSFLDYYDLERYLFTEVSNRYNKFGTLEAFDFFCIVIWKANRAKSSIARRLLGKGDRTRKVFASLDEAVAVLLGEIHNAHDSEHRLALLMDKWGFLLPMASAILTVLYPSEFTVYDVRACGVLKELQLGDFSYLKNVSRPADRWDGYLMYKAAVENAAQPTTLSLRDKDRWLFGKSIADQLEKDLQNNFL